MVPLHSSPGFLLVIMFHCLITLFVYFRWLLQDTQKQQKNELLFQKFGINYKTLPELFRQGSCLFKTKVIVYTFCYKLYILRFYACF